MAINTGPSFMNPEARNTQQIAASPLAARVAKPRMPAMDMARRAMPRPSNNAPMNNMGSMSGMSGGMGNTGKSTGAGFAPTFPGQKNPFAYGGMKTQAPPLMDSGMVGDNAPMPGMGSGMTRYQMPSSGGGYNGSGITGGMGKGILNDAYGGGDIQMPPRMMDPRFRY